MVNDFKYKQYPDGSTGYYSITCIKCGSREWLGHKRDPYCPECEPTPTKPFPKFKVRAITKFTKSRVRRGEL